MWRNNTENNRHKGSKNRAKKAVSKVGREKADETLSELKNSPN